jgi:predicted CoA-substrate-specific enzyme activase
MRYAGIDIGSRTIELLVLEGDVIVESLQADSGFDPMAQANSLLEKVIYDKIMATGYGRHLFELSFESPTVTEIKAYAVGAKKLFPLVRTILDIGGQDSKVIALNDTGRVVKFEMNDRCAAGTGRFLEIMAQTLGYSIEDLGPEALKAKSDLKINSLCTVFAESEVTSLLAKGEDRRDIALALNKSIVNRVVGMLKRISFDNGPVFFAGGVARNKCIRQLLGNSLMREIFSYNNPQMVGAFGAALLASEAKEKTG